MGKFDCDSSTEHQARDQTHLLVEHLEDQLSNAKSQIAVLEEKERICKLEAETARKRWAEEIEVLNRNQSLLSTRLEKAHEDYQGRGKLLRGKLRSAKDLLAMTQSQCDELQMLQRKSQQELMTAQQAMKNLQRKARRKLELEKEVTHLREEVAAARNEAQNHRDCERKAMVLEDKIRNLSKALDQKQDDLKATSRDLVEERKRADLLQEELSQLQATFSQMKVAYENEISELHGMRDDLQEHNAELQDQLHELHLKQEDYHSLKAQAETSQRASLHSTQLEAENEQLQNDLRVEREQHEKCRYEMQAVKKQAELQKRSAAQRELAWGATFKQIEDRVMCIVGQRQNYLLGEDDHGGFFEIESKEATKGQLPPLISSVSHSHTHQTSRAEIKGSVGDIQSESYDYEVDADSSESLPSVRTANCQPEQQNSAFAGQTSYILRAIENLSKRTQLCDQLERNCQRLESACGKSEEKRNQLEAAVRNLTEQLDFALRQAEQQTMLAQRARQQQREGDIDAKKQAATVRDFVGTVVSMLAHVDSTDSLSTHTASSDYLQAGSSELEPKVGSSADINAMLSPVLRHIHGFMSEYRRSHEATEQLSRDLTRNQDQLEASRKELQASEASKTAVIQEQSAAVKDLTQRLEETNQKALETQLQCNKIRAEKTALTQTAAEEVEMLERRLATLHKQLTVANLRSCLLKKQTNSTAAAVLKLQQVSREVHATLQHFPPSMNDKTESDVASFVPTFTNQNTDQKPPCTFRIAAIVVIAMMRFSTIAKEATNNEIATLYQSESGSSLLLRLARGFNGHYIGRAWNDFPRRIRHSIWSELRAVCSTVHAAARCLLDAYQSLAASNVESRLKRTDIIRELENQVGELNEKALILRTRMKQLTAERDELKMQVLNGNRIEDHNLTLQTRIKTLESELSETHASLQQLQTERRNTCSQLREYREILEAKKHETEQLRLELYNSLLQRHAAVQSPSKTLCWFRNDAQSRISRIPVLESALQTARSSLHAFNDDVALFRKENESLRERCFKLHEQLQQGSLTLAGLASVRDGRSGDSQKGDDVMRLPFSDCLSNSGSMHSTCEHHDDTDVSKRPSSGRPRSVSSLDPTPNMSLKLRTSVMQNRRKQPRRGERAPFNRRAGSRVRKGSSPSGSKSRTLQTPDSGMQRRSQRDSRTQKDSTRKNLLRSFELAIR